MWRRLAGGLVDTAAVAGIVAGLIGVGAMPGAFFFEPIEGLLSLEAVGLRLVQQPTLLLKSVFAMTLPLVLWHALWGCFARTPGEWLAGLVVVDATGSLAGPLRRIVRGGAYLSWGASLGLTAFFPWISRTQRGFPDLVARTWVVDARCPAGREVLARRGPRLPTRGRPSVPIGREQRRQ
jgi:uncharacterized RDD family membrane protein YckC